jgi:hypothetical protein
MKRQFNFNFLFDQSFHASDQKFDVNQIHIYLYLYIYQIDVCWSENQKNGLNNGKKFRINFLFQIWIETIRVPMNPWVT